MMAPGLTKAQATHDKQASSISNKSAIVKTLRVANNYFMDKWQDVGKIIYVPSKKKSWPSHIWTRAVYYEGLMAFHKIDPNPTYIKYAMDWGNAHHWSLRDGNTTRNADNQCAGQTYIDLAILKKDTALMSNIKATIGNMLATDKIDDWSWVDAIQMGMPVFAKLGKITGDQKYYDRMWQMYHYTRSELNKIGLFDTKTGLWWRDKDFMPPYKEPNGEDCYWSRGNGWVAAALVRVLNELPKNAPHYKDYLQDYIMMMHAILKYQDPKGYWNVSLADPTHFGGKELTGTALFTYAMAWGVNNGYLKKARYLKPISLAWQSLVSCVHPNGFLGYVQGTGKEPKDSQPVGYDHQPDFEDFGLGCLLLAGSELYKLN
ncbi:glycoside hydrolase family 88 protein [Arachidicoccus terrestris]|nr:glycoside hydrolase family 88 protein [Arachidicoccus terrestris]